jgi:SM-20-related protein
VITIADLGRRQPYLKWAEWLVFEELVSLIEFTNAREEAFRTSRVVNTREGDDRVVPYHRRSRLLTEVGPWGPLMADRMRAFLPRILDGLGYRPSTITRVETQITASNDGDFFRPHNDNAHAKVPTREITYVYFFHREPKPFTGGELVIYDAPVSSAFRDPRRALRIVPEQNEIVFFRSGKMHEVLDVHCRSCAFRDSRFTVNGWLHM